MEMTIQSQMNNSRVTTEYGKLQCRNLLCQGCGNPAVPQISNCRQGHNYCQICVQRMDSRKVCQLCNEILTVDEEYSKMAKDIIFQNGRVKCPFWGSGCTYSNHKMIGVTSHMEACSFRDAACFNQKGPNKCNGKKIPLLQLSRHLKSNHNQRIIKAENGKCSEITVKVPKRVIGKVHQTKVLVLKDDIETPLILHVQTKIKMYNRKVKVWITNQNGILEQRYKADLYIRHENLPDSLYKHHKAVMLPYHQNLDYMRYKLPTRKTKIYVTFKITRFANSMHVQL